MLGAAGMEVSIFGPGKGEAIAVHLGAGDWITVDSCRDQQTGEHPLLSYFEASGVDVARQVRLVVGTHAHDDHISGISTLFEASRSARFVTSSAITAREFFAAMEADADIEAQIGMSVRSEYRAVFAEVGKRGRSIGGQRPMMRALEQLVLWHRPASAGAPGARVLALSPSHEAVTRSLDALAAGASRADLRRKLSSVDPNELAIALWVEVGDAVALLGADLLNGPTGCGWQAVLATHSPDERASLLKVPHHGSPNAHNPGVWEHRLTPDVVAVLAPYRAGRRPLPSPEDIDRICGLSSAAYATAATKLPAPSASVKRTRAALTSVAKNVREPYGRSGQVRARWDVETKSWNVETFKPALRLRAG